MTRRGTIDSPSTIESLNHENEAVKLNDDQIICEEV